MLKVKDLRNSFIDFFKERDHRIVPSSSLVPKDDPTLLFTTAGMVQFKPMFAGTVDLEYTRASTIQKCLRTSDLENVGRTKRHLTLFEMLGNFSFGDYFKEESIEFAWDYSTNVIGFDPEVIWVSIYQDDDEAFEIWKNRIGVPENRIVRLGKADNFWGPAGETGACGPCSELYLDRGEAYGCGSPDCKPGCECERYMEYWNLVFNQFNQDAAGNHTPLPRTGIDTGMGLERLATLVQGVDSVYDTDEFSQLAQFVCERSGQKYEGKNIIPVNIIIEHARAMTFAMSDGIYPSNEGRGYVLRRILRRALRFTRQLGVREPFVYTLVDPVVDIMGEFYPEIKGSMKNVKNVIEGEEKRFLETIENGMDRLDDVMLSLQKKGEKTISGENAFVLYDTFGFPLEMTVEMAEEKSLDVDIKGFEQEMEKQRQRGKQSWKGSDTGLEKAFEKIARETGDTVFTGYDEDETSAFVSSLCIEGEFSDSLSAGDSGLVVLNKTPFYGESGGQTGDRGIITTDSGALFRVEDTKKYNKIMIHTGQLEKGEIKKGEAVTASIDSVNRNLIRANHTVTHLLHSALRNVLGEHVKQAGSLVEAERMRFDFSHFNAMTPDELERVQEIVNLKIWEAVGVTTAKMKLDEAVKSGAMAVFDEKYDDDVRVISVSDFSRELCGGTHVLNTGNIGVFRILKESSPGAGVRRIEAVTLKGVLDRFNEQDTVLTGLTSSLNVAETGLLKKVDDLQKQNRFLEKELEKLKKESLSSGIDSFLENALEVNGIKIISHVFDGAGANELRAISDDIRSRAQNSVVCFGSGTDGKALLLFAATSNAVNKGIDCGGIIKTVSKIVGGGGGGRRDMAQAGGKNPAALKEAIDESVKVAAGMLENI